MDMEPDMGTWVMAPVECCKCHAHSMKVLRIFA